MASKKSKGNPVQGPGRYPGLDQGLTARNLLSERYIKQAMV